MLTGPHCGSPIREDWVIFTPERSGARYRVLSSNQCPPLDKAALQAEWILTETHALESCSEMSEVLLAWPEHPPPLRATVKRCGLPP
jgi:hypothetical protein